MDPIRIIDKYYKDNERLRTILIVHSRLVADKALLSLKNYQANLPLLQSISLFPFPPLSPYPPLNPLNPLSPSLEFTEQAALLHDIGIFRCDAPSIECHGSEPYIRHGVIGADILREEGYPRHALVCERHTGTGLTIEDIKKQKLPLPLRDMTPQSIEEKAICYADKFYSKSGDIRREKTLSQVIKSMSRHGRATLTRLLRLHSLFS